MMIVPAHFRTILGRSKEEDQDEGLPAASQATGLHIHHLHLAGR